MEFSLVLVWLQSGCRVGIADKMSLRRVYETAKFRDPKPTRRLANRLWSVSAVNGGYLLDSKNSSQKYLQTKVDSFDQTWIFSGQRRQN